MYWQAHTCWYITRNTENQDNQIRRDKDWLRGLFGCIYSSTSNINDRWQYGWDEDGWEEFATRPKGHHSMIDYWSISIFKVRKSKAFCPRTWNGTGVMNAVAGDISWAIWRTLWTVVHIMDHLGQVIQRMNRHSSPSVNMPCIMAFLFCLATLVCCTMARGK